MPSRPPAKTPPASRRLPPWDGLLLVAAFSVATVDILWLGARASTLTFCSGTIVSIVVGRLERRGRD